MSQSARTVEWHICLKCCSVGGRPTVQECEAAEQRVEAAAKRWVEQLKAEQAAVRTDGGGVDPESNWDICPVCLEFLSMRLTFPGRAAMREHHVAHKSAQKGSREAKNG